MFKVELHNCDTGAEPAACFATATELEIAERRRHQLEQQYLGPTAPSSSCHSDSGNDH